MYVQNSIMTVQNCHMNGVVIIYTRCTSNTTVATISLKTPCVGVGVLFMMWSDSVCYTHHCYYQCDHVRVGVGVPCMRCV